MTEEQLLRMRLYTQKYRKDNREKALLGEKKYRDSHKEERRLSGKRYRIANHDKVLELKRNSYQRNRKSCIESSRKWASVNKSRRAALNAARYANKKMAMPIWADITLINDIYSEAEYQQMHVDHVVPITSKFVCGLHWEGNLQLLSPEENIKKSNKYWPDK